MTFVVMQGHILFVSTLEETVKDADFIFEVAPEDLKLKQDIFHRK
jgi:3-hydroxyacyl-CoA dehydrogenase